MPAADSTPLSFRDNLFTAFNTFWAARTPLAWPNETFDPGEVFSTPADTDAWTSVTILGDPDSETRRGVQAFERAGSVTLMIHVRVGTLTDKLYTLTDAALEFFELHRPDVKDAILGAPRSVELGPDGTWSIMEVTAPYRYFTNRL